MYHEDPRVNEIVLTIINDGDGSQCGASYQERRDLATLPTTIRMIEFRYLARYYVRHSHAWYRDGEPFTTLKQTSIAGDFLANYYTERIKEST